METKYAGLGDLLAHDPEAKQYYMSLPEYVQGSIMERSPNIQTADCLHRYAENLLAGDK